MKLKLFSTFAFSVTIFALNAQMPSPTTLQGAEKTAAQPPVTATQTLTSAESEAKGSVGSLISQFSGQLTPAAATDEFNKGKSAFQSQANSAKDVKGTAGALQKLAGGLKSTSFTAGWAKIKDKWMADVKAATTTKQLAGCLKTLTQNVDPKFLGSNWEKIKPTFNSALDKLTK